MIFKYSKNIKIFKILRLKKIFFLQNFSDKVAIISRSTTTKFSIRSEKKRTCTGNLYLCYTCNFVTFVILLHLLFFYICYCYTFSFLHLLFSYICCLVTFVILLHLLFCYICYFVTFVILLHLLFFTFVIVTLLVLLHLLFSYINYLVTFVI